MLMSFSFWETLKLTTQSQLSANSYLCITDLIVDYSHRIMRPLSALKVESFTKIEILVGHVQWPPDAVRRGLARGIER